MTDLGGATGGFVSINPADAVQGGGLFDDVDVTLTAVRVALWDYNGSIQTPVPALKVTMLGEGGNEFTQFYSAGDQKNFVPSDDQRHFVPVGKSSGLNDSSNAYAFLASLINSGFPADKVKDDVSVFDGTLCHVGNVPQKVRKGLAAPPDGKPKMVLVVDKIHKLPWENKAAPGPTGPTMSSPVASTPSQTAGSAGPGSPIWAKGAEGLVGILASKGGSCAKGALAQEAFKFFAKDPDRNALVQLLFKDEFLGASGQPWGFDGTTVKLG